MSMLLETTASQTLKEFPDRVLMSSQLMMGTIAIPNHRSVELVESEVPHWVCKKTMKRNYEVPPPGPIEVRRIRSLARGTQGDRR